MGVWWDFVFDNTYQSDAKEAEAAVRKKYPLLLHKDETIEFAFKDRGGKGRDKEYFTSHRILIKDGKGIGGKSKNYVSVPYTSIQAFSVETAGSLDGDVELHVWGSGVPHISIDFAKSNVDIFQLQQLLNSKVTWGESRGHQEVIDSVPPNMDQKQTTAGNIIDWLGDNAKQIDAAEVEQKFKTDTPILLANETVQIAFQSGRDTKAFTNKRLLLVNVKGLTGKKIEFTTILWPLELCSSIFRPDGGEVFGSRYRNETVHQHFRVGCDWTRFSQRQGQFICYSKSLVQSHFG